MRLIAFVFLYYCTPASSWGQPECWPKHVGENFVNKIHHRYESAFVGYLYILDHINAQKMENIKWTVLQFSDYASDIKYQ